MTDEMNCVTKIKALEFNKLQQLKFAAKNRPKANTHAEMAVVVVLLVDWAPPTSEIR